MQDKLAKLSALIRGYGNLCVAYSGGVDSAFLLKIAYDAIGDNVIAVTAESIVHRASELERAKRFSSALGVRHYILQSDDLANPDFVRNPQDRCYYCKLKRFEAIRDFVSKMGFQTVADGANASDKNDYRPGEKATKSLGVVSPLLTAGLTKPEIRAASKALGLPDWDLPSAPCLATRIAFDTPVTRERIERVRQSEDFIAGLFALKTLRVRDFGDRATIEVESQDIPILSQPENFERIETALHKLGYMTVQVDPEGYRMGKLNKIPPKEG